MKAGKYSIRELFVNNYLNQIIIPEIQRDYVWGIQQVIGLLENILEDYRAFQNCDIQLQTDDPEIRTLFESYYKKQKYSSNIGFIYAYNDPEYIGKYFLIDGQQRTTTIYLILLAICVKIDKTVFEKYYFENDLLKVDYKVRDSAHAFMYKFVKYILDGGEHTEENIKQQYWYFTANDLDPTVQSIIHNYNHISGFFQENSLFTADFLYYLQHLIEFWYFDTNMSDQGEELYIYMNARGEQIQSNENLKAELLGKLKTDDLISVEERDDFTETRDLDGLKNYWGKLWESWQDFFWQRKGKNENADTGFNEFINCIAGFELYKRKLDGTDNAQIKINELLNLISIERYIVALDYLERESELFIREYDDAEWVQTYIALIWSYLNKTIKRNANWYVDFRDKNKNDDRNNMILLWSFFYYFDSNGNNLKRDEFFRVMRFFYVRYNNYNRSVSTLKKTIDFISINGIIDSTDNELGANDGNSEEETDTRLRTEEEKVKYSFLAGMVAEPEQIKKFESLIWKIEDHHYNLNGSYLKNKNISHLVDFSSKPSLDEIQKICDRFYLLMSFGEGFEEKKLVTLLLHYGEFWRRVTPWYYFNFEFNDWRRIIRGADGDGKAFKDFFNEFLSFESLKPLSQILEQKNKAFVKQNSSNQKTITDFKAQLIIYSMLLEDIWRVGYHTCYENQEPKEQFLDNELILFNCERYKGSHWYYWDEALKIYANKESMLNHLLARLNEPNKNTNA